MFRTLLFTGMCWFGAAPWASADPAVLTLAQAQREALAADPSVLAARAQLSAAPALREQAAALPNPEVSALLEGRDAATRTSNYLLSQRLELGGKRAARTAQAEQGAHLAAADLAVRTAALRASVMEAYAETLFATAALDNAKKAEQLTASALDVAARRVRAGKISPVEENKARLALAASRIETSRAASQLVAASAQLAHLMGREPGAPATLPDDEPPLMDAALAEERFSRSGLLRRAEADAALATAQVQLERSERVGDVTLQVGVKRDAEAGRRQGVVGISVPLPLFNRNQGKLREALGRADAAELARQTEARRVRMEFSLAREQVQALRGNALILRDTVLPAARVSFDAAVKGFEYGKFGFIDVLDAQRTLLATQAQYTEAAREVWRALARLERLLGPSNTGEYP
jgi:cobalt-zinc-cadmium efflux system outer membrane protein